MIENNSNIEDILRHIQQFDEMTDDRERILHTMFLGRKLSLDCGSLEHDFEIYKIAVQKLISLNVNDRNERVREKAWLAIKIVAEKLKFNNATDLISKLLTEEEKEIALKNLIFHQESSSDEIDEKKHIIMTYNTILDLMDKVLEKTVYGIFSGHSGNLGALLVLYDDILVKDQIKYQRMLSELVDLYNLDIGDEIREILWKYFKRKSEKMGYSNVEEFILQKADNQLIITDNMLEVSEGISKEETKPIIIAETELSSIERCMVSGLPINIEKDKVVACPFCKNQAKRSHLFEWLRVKGFCPMCKEKIRIEVCLNING